VGPVVEPARTTGLVLGPGSNAPGEAPPALLRARRGRVQGR